MATKSISTVYQFKIELIDTEPSVWREVQVPSTFNMFDLHGAINDAMVKKKIIFNLATNIIYVMRTIFQGWSDYHFHVFKVLNPKTRRMDFIGRPIEKLTKGPVDGRSVKITDFFVKPGNSSEYWYDFGDRWEHKDGNTKKLITVTILIRKNSIQPTFIFVHPN